MVGKTLIWWMDSLISLYTVLYFLNDFSTNHSPKEKSTVGTVCYPQLLFWSVEILLRVYIACYQHSYIPIHQFKQKNNRITGIQAVPLWWCNSVPPSLSAHTDIPDCSSTGRWYMSDRWAQASVSSTPAIPFSLGAFPLWPACLPTAQEYHSGRRKCVCADTFHDVKDKFVYLYLQPIAVAADNLTQGFGMQKRWSKPHTALFFGG